jgi:hypothetical protein
MRSGRRGASVRMSSHRSSRNGRVLKRTASSTKVARQVRDEVAERVPRVVGATQVSRSQAGEWLLACGHPLRRGRRGGSGQDRDPDARFAGRRVEQLQRLLHGACPQPVGQSGSERRRLKRRSFVGAPCGGRDGEAARRRGEGWVAGGSSWPDWRQEHRIPSTCPIRSKGAILLKPTPVARHRGTRRTLICHPRDL